MVVVVGKDNSTYSTVHVIINVVEPKVRLNWLWLCSCWALVGRGTWREEDGGVLWVEEGHGLL